MTNELYQLIVAAETATRAAHDQAVAESVENGWWPGLRARLALGRAQSGLMTLVVRYVSEHDD